MSRVEFEFDRGLMEEVVDNLEAYGRVFYTADHAPYVNFDTAWTGSNPPFDPLREWVGRKWNDLDSGLKNAVLVDEDGNDTGIESGSSQHKDAVAWLVVFAIAANGIEGVHFGERAFQKGRVAAPKLAAKWEGSDESEAARFIIEDLTDLMFTESQDIISEEAHDRGTLLQSGQVAVQDEPFESGGDEA